MEAPSEFSDGSELRDPCENVLRRVEELQAPDGRRSAERARALRSAMNALWAAAQESPHPDAAEVMALVEKMLSRTGWSNGLLADFHARLQLAIPSDA